MISVIIPVRNGASTIASAIESARQHADEIIIVDDGSSDDLEKAISPYDITLFRNTGPHGPGAARNKGLAEAKGDFVLFLDADDRLGANQIRALLAALIKSRADMAWCPTLLKSGGRSRIIFPKDWLEFFLAGECLPMHSMLFRREKVPCFDPAFSFEDREWQSRMLVSGMKAVPTPHTCCLYDWNGPKERYTNFPDDRIKIRKRMTEWLAGKCQSRYAHANLYGCLQETFQWGMEVPEISIQLLAKAFALLPGAFPDRRDPHFQGIIQRASRLWHGVQEHPLLEATLACLPKPERSCRRLSEPVPDEIHAMAKTLFPDVLNSERSNSRS